MLTTTGLSEEASQGIVHDLHEIIHDVWRCRSLIVQLTLRDVRVRYKQAVMGFAWAILTPLLVVAAGIVIRIALLHMASERFDVSSATGIVVKGLAWAFVSGAMGFASGALTNNGALISKIYFPRETLPLSIVLACTFDSLIATTALGLALPFTGWRPSGAIVWLPLLAALLFALTLAAGLLVSCANLFFRDVKFIVQLVISFGIFFTPVFYEPAVLGSRWIVPQMLNPLAPIFEGFRLAVNGHNLLQPIVQSSDGTYIWTPFYLYYSAVWSLGGLIASAVIFHRSQFRFAEYI